MKQLTAGIFFELELDIEEGVNNSDVANQLSKLFDIMKETKFDGFTITEVEGELGLESKDKEESDENPLMRDDIMEI